MSGEAIGWVYKHSPYRGAVFQVHVALGDSANDMHGYEIWARQSWIADKARVSRKTANEALQAMVDDGYLALLEDNASVRKPNRYRLLTPDVPFTWHPEHVTPGYMCPVDHVTPGYMSHVTHGYTEPKGKTQPEKKVSPEVDTSPDWSNDVIELCELLAHRVGEQMGKKPKVNQSWYKDMDLLLRRGCTNWAEPEPIPPERIAFSIDYIFDNNEVSASGFCWANNIRSPGKLRKKWDDLKAWAQGRAQAEKQVEDENAWMVR